MYNNKKYYMGQLQLALDEASANLTEGGSDFNNVILDALRHLEKSVAQGLTPWEDYNVEATKRYRVTMDNGVYADKWAPDLLSAYESFKAGCPSAVIRSVVLQE